MVFSWPEEFVFALKMVTGIPALSAISPLIVIWEYSSCIRWKESSKAKYTFYCWAWTVEDPRPGYSWVNSRQYYRSGECTGQFFPNWGEKYTYREQVAVAGCRIEICCHKTEGRRQSSWLTDQETQGRGDRFLEKWGKMNARRVPWRKWLSWFSLNLVLPFSPSQYQKAAFPALARRLGIYPSDLSLPLLSIPKVYSHPLES